ncbi:MAG: hypothetical protein ICV60_05775 [Pyrinomonadaceae bacterium]|nr:hypothetical protein [Pyrinomonadaceae bacterium]
MPGTLIDAAKLKEYFDINKDIADGRLTPHIGAASRRLKQWVGNDAYTDALAEESQDALRKSDLENAEAALAMHFAIPGLNSKVTPTGIVKSSRNDQGKTIITYLSPKEITELAGIYLEQAAEIARPYMLSDGTPEAEFAVVTDE